MEWPELPASGKATKIIGVDPSKGDEPPSCMTKVIWKSGDGNAPFPLTNRYQKWGTKNRRVHKPLEISNHGILRQKNVGRSILH